MAERLLPQPKKYFAQRFALWISLCSMFMAFAGLTSVYIIRRADKNWLEFDLPNQFTISTILIVLSSVTMHFAYRAYKKDHFERFRLLLITTFILGLAFTYFQLSGWNKMNELGYKIIDEGSEVSASLVGVISGFHLFHLAIGLLFLLIAIVRSFFIFKNDPTRSLMKEYQPSKGIRMDLLSTFWHFVDVLWVYLFIFFIINK